METPLDYDLAKTTFKSSTPELLWRFLPKIKVAENGCWLWTASKSMNYGRFNIARIGYQAHRISYVWAKGEIPSNLVIDHLCQNKSCVNPAHLEAVTQRENIKRAVSVVSKNISKTHCKYGHEFSLENTFIDRRGRRCRTCMRNDNKSYYQENKGKEKLRTAAYKKNKKDLLPKTKVVIKSVCMDVHCKCGALAHVDASFAYHVRCEACDTVYFCNGHIELIELLLPPDSMVVMAAVD